MKQHVDKLKVLDENVKFDWYDRKSTFDRAPTACYAGKQFIIFIYWYDSYEDTEIPDWYEVEVCCKSVTFSCKFTELKDIQKVLDYVVDKCVSLEEEYKSLSEGINDYC